MHLSEPFEFEYFLANFFLGGPPHNQVVMWLAFPLQRLQYNFLVAITGVSSWASLNSDFFFQQFKDFLTAFLSTTNNYITCQNELSYFSTWVSAPFCLLQMLHSTCPCWMKYSQKNWTVPKNIHIQGRLTEIPRGGGFREPKYFNWNFQEGMGGQTKKPFHGEYGTTHMYQLKRKRNQNKTEQSCVFRWDYYKICPMHPLELTLLQYICNQRNNCS